MPSLISVLYCIIEVLGFFPSKLQQVWSPTCLELLYEAVGLKLPGVSREECNCLGMESSMRVGWGVCSGRNYFPRGTLNSCLAIGAPQRHCWLLRECSALELP